MADRLILTPDDIEKALQQAQKTPPTPQVLTIRTQDLPVEPKQPPLEGVSFRITPDDLAPAKPTASNTPELIALETLMFGLLNNARQQHLPGWMGNPNLRWHDGLAAVARGHAADMLKRQYVSHMTPEGHKVGQRIDQMNIRYMACGENIGVVYGDASFGDQGIYAIHNAYMRQPRRLTNHRGNLLNPIWTHVGIGAAFDPHGALYVTQIFISTLQRK